MQNKIYTHAIETWPCTASHCTGGTLFLHLILLLRFFCNYKKPSEHFRFVECMISVDFTVAFSLCTHWIILNWIIIIIQDYVPVAPEVPENGGFKHIMNSIQTCIIICILHIRSQVWPVSACQCAGLHGLCHWTSSEHWNSGLPSVPFDMFQLQIDEVLAIPQLTLSHVISFLLVSLSEPRLVGYGGTTLH